jgi:GAF domain-containing protein
MDQDIDGGLLDVLGAVTERLATASSDAVTVRALSPDGTRFVPLAVHHPDPLVRDEMTSTMAEIPQPGDAGLWDPVLRERRPFEYRHAPDRMPAEASPEQVRFLTRHPIIGMIGVPVLRDGVLLGGASLVRYSGPDDFTEEQRTLLGDFAQRVGLLLGWRRELAALAG